jgi:hypothetical protein
MQINITPEELEKLVKGEVVKSSNLDIEIKVVKNKISWEDFPEALTGFYVSTGSKIERFNSTEISLSNRNLFRTPSQASASLALSQLSQWMYLRNEGWEPNWMDSYSKFCLQFYGGEIKGLTYSGSQCFLAFKSPQIRDKFLEDFKDLIMEAKPLL